MVVRSAETGLTIAVDAGGVRHGGALVVLEEVLAALAADARVSEVVLLGSDALKENGIRGRLALVGQVGALRLAWHHVLVPVLTRSVRAHGLICLSNGGRGWGVPVALLIQQAQPFTEEVLEAMTVQQRCRMGVIALDMKWSARVADAVFVQTNFMRTAVSARFRVPPDSIYLFGRHPAHLPSPVRPAADLNALAPSSRGRRFLYVGSDPPHKNVSRLLEAFEIVYRHDPHARLFLVGHCNLPAPAKWAIKMGYVPRESLRSVYEQADVLLFPSLSETAALPLQEAQVVGLPILASDRPYAREACGPYADYFDPLDVDSMAATCIRAIRAARRAPVVATKPGGSYKAIVDWVVEAALRAGRPGRSIAGQ